MDEAERTSFARDLALGLACPNCAVPAGELCAGRRATRNGVPWKRKSLHVERYLALGAVGPLLRQAAGRRHPVRKQQM